jgi:hypothetical protein
MKGPTTILDLSWIEHVWGIEARQVQGMTDFRVKNFEDAVFEEREKLAHSAMRALYTSIRRRLKGCLAVKSGSTKCHWVLRRCVKCLTKTTSR